MKKCTECTSEIPEEAEVCRFCGERVEGKPCPDCGSRCPEEARKCRWCGFQFEKAAALHFEPFRVDASLLPTVLQRGRFIPQSIELTREKIVISTPGVFRLSQRDEEIPWEKVAGFDYRSGLIWDVVRIETRGQSSAIIPCLNKSDGRKIREVLRQLER